MELDFGWWFLATVIAVVLVEGSPIVLDFIFDLYDKWFPPKN